MTTEELNEKLAKINPALKIQAKTFLNKRAIQRLSRSARVIKLQKEAKVEAVTAIVLDLANQMYIL